MSLYMVTQPSPFFVSRVTHDRAGQTDWRAGAKLVTPCSTHDWIIVRGDFKNVRVTK
jgi:hypothetical protein